MFKLPISLGIRYFFGAKGGFGSFYSIISVIGLTIGVAALIIVLSVMNGFENELKNRILGVVPHLTIKSTKPISIDDANLEVILKNKKNVGILICGTGVGMSIAANRKKGIRAGLANNSKIARLIRKHNDANVLVLPGRFINTSEAKKSVQAFLSTKFESGRHKRRIKKL